MGDTCRNCRGEKTEIVYPGGLAMAVPCRACNGTGHIPAPKPDPRDARIAELEAALAGLVDALPRCDTCTKRGTTDWSGYGQAAIYCDEHLGFKSGSTLEWDSEAEAAERALGRRK